MGLRVRHIQTTTVTEQVDGQPVARVVPVLTEAGQEIELYSVEIPATVEAEGGAATDAYVAAELARRAAAPDPDAPIPDSPSAE